DIERLRQQMAAVIAEAQSPDPWTSRARPMFLYVMYALLLWAIPMGVIAAIAPAMATNIAAGMNAYLAGIPEPLYALFGTGYLGYTVARSWGKAKQFQLGRVARLGIGYQFVEKPRDGADDGIHDGHVDPF
ncbi:MAG: hypothetical protein EOP68_25680, partial [Sphingomonas sp.]